MNRAPNLRAAVRPSLPGVAMLVVAAAFAPAALGAPSVAISPGYTNLGVNQTLQYTATVTGLTNTSVTWKVNNVTGGNSTIGTITAAGLYKAPAAVPTVGTLVVALASDGKTTGGVYVNVEPAGPSITAVSPNPISVGNFSVTLTGTAFKSGAIVQFNGANLTTTFVSATTLKTSGYQGSATSGVFSVENPGTLFGPQFSVPFVKAPPAQTITPTSATVKLGGTQQFTSAGATAWTATAGTVSSAGLYAAPSTMPSPSTVTVTATGPGGSASATVTLQSADAQKISPTSVTLNLGAMQQFTSAGATAWTATAGTVSSSGLYTAPSTMPSSSTVTVKATGPAGSASATVTLQSVTTQSISPTSVTLNLGAMQQFTSAGATAWTATAGTVSSSGLYTAPSTMPSSSTVTVKATGPAGSASATVTLQAVNTQTISPTSVTLNLGGTQQFTSSGATAWAATNGAVTAAGFYTAPATLPSSGVDTVTATGPNGAAAATVTLIPPTPVITGVNGNGQLPLGVFSATIAGTGFQAGSIAKLNGTPMGTTYAAGSLTASGVASVSGPGDITVSTGSLTSAPFAVQIGVANAQVSAAAARRFLEQAAFGPTPTDAVNLQTLGFQGWLNQQFAMGQISNYNTITSSQGGMPTHFMTNAVMNSDQLRQRVAFALSQIFVTSFQKLIWNDNMVPFQNMLLADAFTNYRQIMADVTLSPAMGQYLDMANNAMGNPTAGTLANENYARELMQLFSLGTNMLNQDGTLQLDGNHLPVPTYTQATIGQFARVYTGWTYAPAPGGTVNWDAYISSYGPMVPYAPEHDPGSKTLLNGYVSPAGVTPQQDLNNALDNIFNHSNAGPFVGTLLIQHLVKSNPSPAYVSRVAAAFNNNGMGVRGDMQATIAAILLDPEARANDNGGNDLTADGHLQEPVVFIAGMIRAFGGQMSDQNYFEWDMVNMDQDLFNAPSVFNYYSETYQVPGTPLMGGEYQIHTPNVSIWRANVVATLFSQWSNPLETYGPGTSVDLTAFVPLAATPANLVSALDLTLTHGTMPAAMKTAIVNAVTADTGGSLHQVETACYLILTSSYYNVWH